MGPTEWYLFVIAHVKVDWVHALIFPLIMKSEFQFLRKFIFSTSMYKTVVSWQIHRKCAMIFLLTIFFLARASHGYLIWHKQLKSLRNKFVQDMDSFFIMVRDMKGHIVRWLYGLGYETWDKFFERRGKGGSFHFHHIFSLLGSFLINHTTIGTMI